IAMNLCASVLDSSALDNSVICVPRNPPAAFFQTLDRTPQRGRRHADVGEAELGPRRVLQSQVLHVHTQLAQLAEQATELTGGVVDHDDELLEAAVLTVLARQALHALVALADGIRDGTAGAGCVGLAQRARQ